MIRNTVSLGFIVFMILMFAYPASAKEVLADKKLLEKILQRQDALEKEIEQLKKQLREKQDKAATEKTPEDITYIKETVEDMSKTLDAVETKSILDKIILSGDFRVRMDSFHYDDHEFAGQKKDGNTEELWSTRMRLNLRSEITDNIIFHGRLNYFKLWGNSNFDRLPTDRTYPSIPDQEGNLHVERAYIDYFVPETPVSLTFGRLPIGEGPPNEFRDYTTRKGTWPKIVYDIEADGIIANLSLEKWTGLSNAMFRIAYSKLSQNYLKYKGEKLDDFRVFSGSFETEIPGVRGSLLWLSYMKAIGMTPLNDVPGADYPDNSGDTDFYIAYLHLTDILDADLDWFVSFAYEKIDARAEGTELAPGYEVGMFGDTLNANLGENRNGHCIYTGLRYKLPFGFLKYPRLGFEYNYGSKYWIGAATSSGDIENKLLINGKGYEFYYIQPLHKNAFCRIGAVCTDYDYYNPMFYFGDQPESDMTLINYYFLTNVRF